MYRQIDRQIQVLVCNLPTYLCITAQHVSRCVSINIYICMRAKPHPSIHPSIHTRATSSNPPKPHKHHNPPHFTSHSHQPTQPNPRASSPQPPEAKNCDVRQNTNQIMDRFVLLYLALPYCAYYYYQELNRAPPWYYLPCLGKVSKWLGKVGSAVVRQMRGWGWGWGWGVQYVQ